MNKNLTQHHHRVAYIATAIAAEYGLNLSRIKNTTLAALLHDIGLMVTSEVKNLSTFDIGDDGKLSHSKIGSYLLKEVSFFQELSDIIEKHHFKYKDYPDIEDEPLIIFLADRIDILLDRNKASYYQKDKICDIISSESGKMFKPEHVEAFLKFKDKEYFWLELDMPDKDKILRKYIQYDIYDLNIENIMEFTKFIGQLIDFRCSFTATHSVRVANTAATLSRYCGFDEQKQKEVEIAGYLHDIGKLGIDPYIINKNGPLTIDEMAEMRKHTYYTYYILTSLEIFDDLKYMAAFHHEYLDGTGYPFHLKADRLTTGCRLMTIADIFTALTEDRPYRKGMKIDKTLSILETFAKNGKIDCNILDILKENIDEIQYISKSLHNEVIAKYNNFKNVLI
jgi:putative nucleotidyltransferase with HDIG domain